MDEPGREPSDQSGAKERSARVEADEGSGSASAAPMERMVDRARPRAHDLPPVPADDAGRLGEDPSLLTVRRRREVRPGEDRDHRPERSGDGRTDDRRQLRIAAPGRLAERSARAAPARSQGSGDGRGSGLHHDPVRDPELPAVAPVRRRVHLPRSAGRPAARRRIGCDRRQPGEALRRRATDDALRRRGRLRGREARGARGRRVPETSEPLQEDRGGWAARPAARRSTGDGQDAPRAGGRGRGQRSVLLRDGIQLRGDVRGGGGGPRSRPLR